MLAGFDPSQIQDLEGARQAIVMLLNLVEELKSDNVRFLKEKFYSASERQTYLASLPAGYEGEFVPVCVPWLSLSIMPLG